jgi:hypothetical protein
MRQTEFNGTFGLYEITKIVLRHMGLNTVYCIKFVDEEDFVIATKLHCFLTDDGQPKTITDLKAGEKIWVNRRDFIEN